MAWCSVIPKHCSCCSAPPGGAPHPPSAALNRTSCSSAPARGGGQCRCAAGISAQGRGGVGARRPSPGEGRQERSVVSGGGWRALATHLPSRSNRQRGDDGAQLSADRRRPPGGVGRYRQPSRAASRRGEGDGQSHAARRRRAAGQFGKAYEEIEVRADLVTLRLGAHLEVALVGSSRAGVTGSRSWNHPRCAPDWPAPAPPSERSTTGIHLDLNDPEHGWVVNPSTNAQRRERGCRAEGQPRRTGCWSSVTQFCWSSDSALR